MDEKGKLFDIIDLYSLKSAMWGFAWYPKWFKINNDSQAGNIDFIDYKWRPLKLEIKNWELYIEWEEYS